MTTQQHITTETWSEVLASLARQTTASIYDALLKPLEVKIVLGNILYLAAPEARIKMLKAQWETRILAALPSGLGIEGIVFDKAQEAVSEALDVAAESTEKMALEGAVYKGFDMPRENWSKMPHSLIGEFPRIKGEAELKIIFYILRHTWGWRDGEKKITVDEFMKGRKTTNPDRACQCEVCLRQGKTDRIDHGTGMGKAAVLRGLKRAEGHGFITVEIDRSDKARTRKYYRLNYCET